MFLKTLLLKFCENGRHAIEDILEVTPTLPFLTIFRLEIFSFLNLHKMVARRSAFLAFPSAQNKGESKGGLNTERFKMPIYTNGRGFKFTRIP
jgi:hypothetical protein